MSSLHASTGFNPLLARPVLGNKGLNLIKVCGHEGTNYLLCSQIVTSAVIRVYCDVRLVVTQCFALFFMTEFSRQISGSCSRQGCILMQGCMHEFILNLPDQKCLCACDSIYIVKLFHFIVSFFYFKVFDRVMWIFCHLWCRLVCALVYPFHYYTFNYYKFNLFLNVSLIIDFKNVYFFIFIFLHFSYLSFSCFLTVLAVLLSLTHCIFLR